MTEAVGTKSVQTFQGHFYFPRADVHGSGLLRRIGRFAERVPARRWKQRDVKREVKDEQKSTGDKQRRRREII